MRHCLGISRNFTSYQKKQTPSQYQSLEQLTVYNMVTNNLICLIIYILKFRAQNLLV